MIILSRSTPTTASGPKSEADSPMTLAAASRTLSSECLKLLSPTRRPASAHIGRLIISLPRSSFDCSIRCFRRASASNTPASASRAALLMAGSLLRLDLADDVERPVTSVFTLDAADTTDASSPITLRGLPITLRDDVPGRMATRSSSTMPSASAVPRSERGRWLTNSLTVMAVSKRTLGTSDIRPDFTASRIVAMPPESSVKAPGNTFSRAATAGSQGLPDSIARTSGNLPDSSCTEAACGYNSTRVPMMAAPD